MDFFAAIVTSASSAVVVCLRYPLLILTIHFRCLHRLLEPSLIWSVGVHAFPNRSRIVFEDQIILLDLECDRSRKDCHAPNTHCLRCIKTKIVKTQNHPPLRNTTDSHWVAQVFSRSRQRSLTPNCVTNASKTRARKHHQCMRWQASVFQPMCYMVHVP